MRVLAFGTFDPLHEGHVEFVRQAAALGDELWVVVARDSAIREMKKRAPHQDEAARLAAVQQQDEVDEAMLGDQWPIDDKYGLLSRLEFDVLALGYDQLPSEELIRAELDERGKPDVKIVRLRPYRADQFKSSKLR